MAADPGAADPGTTDGPSWLEQALHVARATNDYTPVWPAFVNSTFVVPVYLGEPEDGSDEPTGGSDEPAGSDEPVAEVGHPAFHFAVRSSADRPVLVIAEQEAHLAAFHQERTAVSLAGAALIEALHPEVGIIVHRGPDADVFGIRPDLVQRLRVSLDDPGAVGP